MLAAIVGPGIVLFVSDCDIFSAIQILLNQSVVAVMVSHGQRTAAIGNLVCAICQKGTEGRSLL